MAEEMAQKVIIVDKEGKAYMHRAEKICQKIKCCCIPFLPEASIWMRHVQVYYLLLCYHKGKIKNRRNLKQSAQQCNIPNPLSLSIQEITLASKHAAGMRILSGTRQTVLLEAPGEQEKNSKRAKRRGGI